MRTNLLMRNIMLTINNNKKYMRIIVKEINR